ncbi:hypothetical protein [Bradyrhizobium sp. SZCCHNRI2049]|uniref:hypothetical protein n=1 Tax=Bradyrhizobium sp. SZCCHNRI2049 TaxID=3057287 RepID=UPI002916776D|nr:hypothetical protein [Bradyrhizobium sp. SZCCHNRI2049]
MTRQLLAVEHQGRISLEPTGRPGEARLTVKDDSGPICAFNVQLDTLADLVVAARKKGAH